MNKLEVGVQWHGGCPSMCRMLRLAYQAACPLLLPLLAVTALVVILALCGSM